MPVFERELCATMKKYGLDRVHAYSLILLTRDYEIKTARKLLKKQKFRKNKYAGFFRR